MQTLPLVTQGYLGIPLLPELPGTDGACTCFTSGYLGLPSVLPELPGTDDACTCFTSGYPRLPSVTCVTRVIRY